MWGRWGGGVGNYFVWVDGTVGVFPPRAFFLCLWGTYALPSSSAALQARRGQLALWRFATPQGQLDSDRCTVIAVVRTPGIFLFVGTEACHCFPPVIVRVLTSGLWFEPLRVWASEVTRQTPTAA